MDAVESTNRSKLGLGLMVGGLVAFLPLMIYIVMVRTPSTMIIVLTLSCWVVFFVGKTMLKTKEPNHSAQNE